MHVEVSVVGGGPAGLLTALNIGLEGHQVHLFESKETIGKTEHCAGLLSLDGLDKIGLDALPSGIIQNDNILGGKLYSPTGRELIVKKSQSHAIVVNRARFDQYLANLAQQNNVIIHTSSRVVNINRKKNNLELILGRKKEYSKFSSNLAILAEGRFPRLNSKVGLPVPRKSDIVFTTQFLVSNINNLDPQFVELFQTNQYAPGFFAWIIPISKTTAKIGLGSVNRPTKNYLEQFMYNHPSVKDRLYNAKILQKMSGAIPLGGPIKRTYTDNVLIVGDAASQTKPTTGGGVVFGGIAALHAANITIQAIKEQDYSSKILSNYEKAWKKNLKKELFYMRCVRKYLNCISDKDTDRLFELLNDSKIKDLFTNYGHVDNQRKIVQKCLLEPRLWPFILKTGLKFLFS